MFAGLWSASKGISGEASALCAARKAERVLNCGSAVGARSFTIAAVHARRPTGQNTRACAARRRDLDVERGKGVTINSVGRVGGKEEEGETKG